MAYNTIGVVQQAISISSQLAQLVNSYLCMPVIGGIGNAASLALANLAADAASGYGSYTAGGVRIEPLTYREEYQADVSEQLVININGGKDYLTDNVAARPRTWRISGYIPGDLITDVLGMTGLVNGALTGIQGPNILALAAGLGAIQSEVSSLFMPSLKAKKDYIHKLFYNQHPFQFKTRENEIILNAVMSQCIIERKPESQNKLNIEVVIHEINMLTIKDTNGTDASVLPSTATNGDTRPVDCGSGTSGLVSIETSSYTTPQSVSIMTVLNMTAGKSPATVGF